MSRCSWRSSCSSGRCSRAPSRASGQPYLVPVVVPVLRARRIARDAPIVGLGRRAARALRATSADAPSVDVEREALQDLLREGELEGVGEREEIAIISGVVEFGEKRRARRDDAALRHLRA